MIVALEAFKLGLFTRKNFLKNAIGGVVVGVISLPLSMAFAIASGVTPEIGIYTAIVAGLCVSIFGGSRYQIAGPTGAFVPLLYSVVGEFGLDGLQLATILAGIILIFMGIAKFGRLLKYIPTQVVVGFTSGIGTLLFMGQLQNFLGSTDRVLIHGPTLAMGIGCLFLLIGMRFIPYMKHVPAPLCVLVVSAIVSASMSSHSIETVGSTFGGISNTLPMPALPGGITAGRCLALLGPAFAIAILGAIESLLSAVVADGMTGTKHHSNQELIGQGIANILCPLFSGIAATGAIARTAANVRAGGTTPMSGIFASISLLLILLLCAPLAKFIPLVALAAILFVISYHMLGLSYFLHLLRHAPRTDVGILLTTYFLTIFCGLVIAVNVGIVLSSLFLMQRLASSIHIECNKPIESSEDLELLSNIPNNVAVYSVSGPLFFAMAEKLELITAQVGSKVQIVILRLHGVPFIDTTALTNLRQVIRKFQTSGRIFAFCEASEKVAHKLDRAELKDSLTIGNSKRTLLETLYAVREYMQNQGKS
ncbi:MAG: STAS domain-containing protein [Puniceicoccales bacterium]|nr:STAS domain-containing protein [Puniceicoccales bacterium]